MHCFAIFQLCFKLRMQLYMHYCIRNDEYGKVRSFFIFIIYDDFQKNSDLCCIMSPTFECKMMCIDLIDPLMIDFNR